MRKINSFRVLFTAASLIVMIFFCGAIHSAQKTDTKKIYAEIAGEYEFDMEGQVMLFTVTVEGDKLMGSPEGEDPAELEPVKGESLKFEINTPEGDKFELEFIRDETGKIAKCIAINEVMGMELEGKKIK